MIKKFADNLVEENLINVDDYELYTYGMKEGLILLANIITTVIIGILLNMWWQSILFMLAYIPLRSFAGGAHAKTHLRCYLSSILMTLLVLISIKYLPQSDVVTLFIGLLAGAIVFILAPVEDSNKPLDELEIKVYKKKARIILCIEIVIISILIVFDLIYIAKCMAVSLFTLAITLLAGKIKNMREEKYKVKN